MRKEVVAALKRFEAGEGTTEEVEQALGYVRVRMLWGCPTKGHSHTRSTARMGAACWHDESNTHGHMGSTDDGERVPSWQLCGTYVE